MINWLKKKLGLDNPMAVSMFVFALCLPFLLLWELIKAGFSKLKGLFS